MKTKTAPPLPRLIGPFAHGRAMAIYPTGHVVVLERTGEVADIRLRDEAGGDLDALPCVPGDEAVVFEHNILWPDSSGRLHSLDAQGRYMVTPHTLPSADRVQEVVAKREAALIEMQRLQAVAKAEDAKRRAAQAEAEAKRWKEEAENRAKLAGDLDEQKQIAETGVGATDARRRALELVNRIQAQ